MPFFLVSCSCQDPEEGRASGKVLLLYNPNMTLPIDDIYVFTVLNKLFYIKGNSSHTHRPIHVNFTLIEMNTSKMTFFLPLKNIHIWKENSSLLLCSYEQTSSKCQFKKQSFIFHAIFRHSTCFVTRLPLNPHQHG